MPQFMTMVKNGLLISAGMWLYYGFGKMQIDKVWK